MTSTPTALKKQREQRSANIAAGLTWDGRPRKNYLWPELDGLPRRERMNERIRLTKLRNERARRNGGLGFVLDKKPSNHSAWKVERIILRAQIEAAAGSIAEVFFNLPPKAQVACLELAGTLSQIQKGLR